MSIKFASKPDLHHLQQFLHGRQRDAPQETIQVLDVVFRTKPSFKLVYTKLFYHCIYYADGNDDYFLFPDTQLLEGLFSRLLWGNPVNWVMVLSTGGDITKVYDLYKWVSL